MLIILTGKSASGKTTLMDALIQDEEVDFEKVVTATTRPMREGEKDGVSYHFLSSDEFLDGVKHDRFVEWTAFNGYYYGSPKSSVDLSKKQVIVLEPEGVRAFLDAFGKENTMLIYMDADDAVRKDRAMARGSFNEEEWQMRTESDNERFGEAFMQLIDECGMRLPVDTLDTINDTINEFYSLLTQYEFGEEAAHDVPETPLYL